MHRKTNAHSLSAIFLNKVRCYTLKKLTHRCFALCTIFMKKKGCNALKYFPNVLHYNVFEQKRVQYIKIFNSWKKLTPCPPSLQFSYQRMGIILKKSFFPFAFFSDLFWVLHCNTHEKVLYIKTLSKRPLLLQYS